MTAEAYLICATPRSGSTLLCDLLAGTGVAGRPESYYRRQSIADLARQLGVTTAGPTEGAEFDRAYLEAVRREGTGDTGMFGMRLMQETLPELSARLDGMFPGLPDTPARLERAFGKLGYIHLSRRDKVAQAVSLIKAHQSGLWHMAADGTERERAAPHQAPIYDADQIEREVAELTADDAAWTQWFEDYRIEPARVLYEELSADPRRTLAGILSALGLDPAVAVAAQVKTSRLADAQSLSWVSRYRAESAGS